MALTQLSDVIVPETYQSYTSVDNVELTAFYESGIIVQNAALDAFANAGGIQNNVPFWMDLDLTDEPNYSTDDPTDVAVPGKIAAAKMVVRTAQMNNGWSAADLTGELAGSDPMKRIAARTNAYWTYQWQTRLLKTCLGLLAENVATHGGDMVYDVSVADIANATDANLFGRQVFTGGVFTMGDRFNSIAAIAVHSVVYKRMVDNNDIEFIPDSNGTLSIPTYLGKRVIVDDGMPVAAAGAGFTYTSILFGAGAFGYGVGSPRVPMEVWRDPKAGNGGGIEELWERKTWLIHPFGYKWNNDAAVAGQSPTFAELATAANWTRVLNRKLIPLAFVKTNG